MDSVLIVCRDGKLSAAPTREQFGQGRFITDPALVVVFDVQLSPFVQMALKMAADSVWITGEGLPKPDPQPGRTYLVVYNGRLWTMKKGV